MSCSFDHFASFVQALVFLTKHNNLAHTQVKGRVDRGKG